MILEEYLEQVWTVKYISPVPEFLYELLSTEGWLEAQEEEYKEKLSDIDLAYFKLQISNEDIAGLISMNEDVINKFNEFDIKLKSEQEYPYSTCDFIDYDKGIVYIVTLADAVSDDY